MEALAIQQNKELGIPVGAWGAEDCSKADVLIPRLNLMQAISPQVQDQKCRAGVFLNSVTGLVHESLEIIPITMNREFILMDATDDPKQPDYVSREPITAQNESAPLEYIDKGKSMVRIKQLNLLCLSVDDLDGLPLMIGFKKSGMYAGKVISTHFQSSALKAQPGARLTFKLSSEKRMNGKNDYCVPVFSAGRPTSPEELAKAYFWFQSWKSSSVKVDEAVAKGSDEAVPF